MNSAPTSRPPAAAQTIVQRTASLKFSGPRWSLTTTANRPLSPLSLVVANDDLFLLTPEALWKVQGGSAVLSKPQILRAAEFKPAKAKVGHVPVQEFFAAVFSPQRKTVIILDKSGDLFEFNPKTCKWSVFRPNHPVTGSPDPEYIDMALMGKNVCLLDPERNQLWRYPASAAKMLKEVMPWRLKPGDISVADGIGAAFDGHIWVLGRTGRIQRFEANPDNGPAKKLPFNWKPPSDLRPSRIQTSNQAPLYIVERENNRVLAVNKTDGVWRQYLFPQGSDLRTVLPSQDGFWILEGSNIHYRPAAHSNLYSTKCATRTIDDRLTGLVMPLKGSLPRHPGVWPGARRLYRHGVHKGTDFFNDPGCGTIIEMGTAVKAADGGKLVRYDCNFHDMDAAKYGSVIRQCIQQHISSEPNEDLLRGCQVWIDHGGGLVTKYAHLDKVKPGLKTGMKISRGDLIGYVGVSGTGENLPGRGKHPHLHFEVWLDQKYLGWGLTPAETIGVYEDIFGTVCKRGGS